MNTKTKTLGDYITCGRHEFVAHIRNMASLCDGNRSNHHTIGNNLGEIYIGVLVCDMSDSTGRAQFFHKEPPIYNGDSDIMFGDFDYSSAKVISEVPLGIELDGFWSGQQLEKRGKRFKEAKALMKKYGIY